MKYKLFATVLMVALSGCSVFRSGDVLPVKNFSVYKDEEKKVLYYRKIDASYEWVRKRGAVVDDRGLCWYELKKSDQFKINENRLGDEDVEAEFYPSISGPFSMPSMGRYFLSVVTLGVIPYVYTMDMEMTADVTNRKNYISKKITVKDSITTVQWLLPALLVMPDKSDAYRSAYTEMCDNLIVKIDAFSREK
jgi:hypothetical protein